MPVKECDPIFNAAYDYIEELRLMKEAHVQWLEEVDKKHHELLLADKKSNHQELLPKTPALKSRLRKRTWKVKRESDEDQSCPSDKPSSYDYNVKKFSICLTRIDENPTQQTPEQPLKQKRPAKPPRTLKSLKHGGTKQQKNLAHADGDDNISPSAMFTSSATVLSQEETTESNSQVTCPLKLNVEDHIKRQTALDSSVARMSVSRRRSSLMRQKLRTSARLAKRISSVKLKTEQSISSVDDGHNSMFKDENTDLEEIPLADKRVEIGIVECEEAAIPQQVAVVKKGRTGSGATEQDDSGQFDITHIIEKSVINKQLDGDLPNSGNAQCSLKVMETNITNSLKLNGSENVDSVMSNTPSPLCLTNKIVHPKLNAMTASLANCYETPVSSTVSKNLHSLTGYCSKRTKATRAKVPVPAASTSKKRNGNLSRSMFSIGLSPQVMTPQEKQEKIRLREIKSQEVLRKRNEYLKKKIEDQRRKREAKLRKVLQAKEHNTKQYEAKLLKILEEEEKRKQSNLVKKKEQEDRLAEQRKHVEEQRAESQKQMEIEKEKQREILRLKEEMEKQREQERIALEQRRLAEEKAKEQKRLAEEKAKEQKKLADEELRKDKQKKLLAEKHLQPNVEQTVKVAVNKANGQLPLNTTVTLDSSVNNNYDLTPQRISPSPNVDPNNYDIDNMKEGDSTDDEEQPRKKIPPWAEGRAFKIAILEQLRKPVNIEEIFPRRELMLLPQLSDIFGTKKRRFLQRTSSALWTSPLVKDDLH